MVKCYSFLLKRGIRQNDGKMLLILPFGKNEAKMLVKCYSFLGRNEAKEETKQRWNKGKQLMLLYSPFGRMERIGKVTGEITEESYRYRINARSRDETEMDTLR